MLKGIAASQGIAIGKALVIGEEKPEVKKVEISDTDNEKKRLKEATDIAMEQLEKIRTITEEKLGHDKAEIFDAHILMLQDPEFIGAVEQKIDNQKINAEYALKETVSEFVILFEQMDNEYMRERASDIRDIGGRILNILLGIDNTSISFIDKECVVVIKDLTPSDTAQMDKDKVLGFVTEIGGRTSHSAIMARSLEIPAVVGTGNATTAVKNNDLIIVDGEEGLVLVNPDENTLNEYKEKQEKLLSVKVELQKLKELDTITTDGKKVEIAGNIGSPKDIEGVLKNGGEGVGLFRTEFLYMNSNSLPSEEQQFDAYKEVLENMNGKPVVIRTLDIGGDKKLPYLSIGEEMNPFLGYRAIRLCLDRKDIFKTQLRALFRASVYGKLRIMFPMISGVNEIREAKEIVEEVKRELRNDNIDYSDDVQIGIMIEIPSAAVISDILAKEVDFFSIGTNDLIQYSLAADRMNEKVSYLYDPLHPAVLRLIRLVIKNAHKEGKWVGVCGEMGGDVRAIPLLLGMGLDEFSMSASSLLNARKLIRSLNHEKLNNIIEEALLLGTSDEIRNFIEKNI